MVELATVLWNPRAAVSRIEANRVNTLALVLTVFSIDLSLSLTLMPLVHAAVRQAMLLHPELPSSSRWVLAMFAVVFGTLINLALGLLVALLMYLGTAVLKGTGTFRQLFEGILIGSAPLVLSRVIRVLLFAFRLSPKMLTGLGTLGTLLPASSPHLLRSLNFDLFDLWSLLLLAYTYSRISGLRRMVSWGSVLAFWCALQAVSIRFQSIVSTR